MEPVRNRTLRRRQRQQIINDYLADLDTVQKHLDNAITEKQVRAFSALYDLLYASYIEIVSSEV